MVTPELLGVALGVLLVAGIAWRSAQAKAKGLEDLIGDHDADGAGQSLRDVVMRLDGKLDARMGSVESRLERLEERVLGIPPAPPPPPH